jgi:hypothetical protein
LFLHNTSRVADEPYPTLLQDKGFGGFPSLCFMDAEGNVLAKPGRSVEAFRETHAGAMALVALRAKKDRSAKEEKELFFTELQLDLIPPDEIRARADKLPALTKEELTRIDQRIVDGEVRTLAARLRSKPDELAEKFFGIAKAGRQPSDEIDPQFWHLVLKVASEKKDIDVAQRAHDELLRLMASRSGPDFDKVRENWAKQLEAARSKD